MILCKTNFLYRTRHVKAGFSTKLSFYNPNRLMVYLPGLNLFKNSP